MEKSSFFNSVSHDRTYKAEDWAEYFASFIGNGVFPVPSTGLQVVANDGMKLNVKTGKAWINGYFYFNTGDLAVELDTADGQLNRIIQLLPMFLYLLPRLHSVVFVLHTLLPCS